LIERSTFHVSVTVSITSITAPEEYEGEYKHRLPVAGSYTVTFTEIGRRLDLGFRVSLGLGPRVRATLHDEEVSGEDTVSILDADEPVLYPEGNDQVERAFTLDATVDKGYVSFSCDTPHGSNTARGRSIAAARSLPG
jgi:hypothetical protein